MFRWSEIVVGIVFICTIILWITKDLSGIGGWSAIFEKDFVSDGTVAMLCGILPLILPNANPFQSRTIKRKKKYEQENLVFEDDWTYQPIITWNNLAKNMPWGALLLLGAGLSVASAFQMSKLSLSVAHALKFLAKIPRAGVIILIIVISGLFTEVTSNLSTASIFFPVLDSVVILMRLLKIEHQRNLVFFVLHLGTIVEYSSSVLNSSLYISCFISFYVADW